MKKLLKICRVALLALVALCCTLIFLLQLETVQTYLVKKAAQQLSQTLKTQVSVKRVSITFFNKLNIEDVLVKDLQQDTLLFVGSLKVRITDWFFLKQSNELKYIGLEHGVIKLQRKNAIWNYHFIEQAFADTSTNKNSTSPKLALKKIDVRDLRIEENDYWRGEEIKVSVQNFEADITATNWAKRDIKIDKIQFSKPIVKLIESKGLRPDSLKPKKYNYTADTGWLLNPAHLALQINKLSINNGTFMLIDADQKTIQPYFDPGFIVVNKINASFNDVLLHKDTVTAKMKLSAFERSGLQVKKLQANFKANPRIMEFSNLDLITNKSHITNYYAMCFKHFEDDFDDYEEKVLMKANIKQSNVHTDDVAFFANELKHWKKACTISTNFEGTVSQFIANNLMANLGTQTLVTGQLSMKGLPDIDNTIITYKNGFLKSNYDDFCTYVPDLKQVTQPNFKNLGQFLFKGNFNGKLNNFSTAGTWSTDIGSFFTDISINLPSLDKAVYKGQLSTNNFNLGKFIENDKLGLVNFNGDVEGFSFSLKNVLAHFNGKFSSLDYNGYTYTNLFTNGNFENKKFSGELKCADPNVATNSLVDIDFSSSIPKFNILADISKIRLKPLNLSNNNINIVGLVDANFEGNNIDNFLGAAKFINGRIQDDHKTISIDSVLISTNIIDGKKNLHLGGDAVQANLSGNFSILDLPNSFQLFLNHYYPSVIAAPKTIPQNQNFSFDIKTFGIEPYIQLFDKNWEGFDSSHIQGILNTQQSVLSFKGLIPKAAYKKYSFYNTQITASGNFDSLNLNASADNIVISDSLNFPSVKILANSSNDVSAVQVQAIGKGAIDALDLQAQVYSLEDGVRIHAKPSYITLNNKKLLLQKEGELVLRKNYIQAENILFKHHDQEIKVETKEPEGGNINNLEIGLQKVEFGDVLKKFLPNPQITGKLSGHVEVTDFFNNPQIKANLQSEETKLNADSVGTIFLTGEYSKQTNKLQYSATSGNKHYNFNTYGHYNFSDSVKQPLESVVQFNDVKIDFLKEYLADIFSDISGFVSGKLQVNTQQLKTNMLGKLKLKQAHVKVNFTQVSYVIPETELNFDEEGIDFRQTTLFDTLGNKATLSGKLFENNFKNMYYNFSLQTNKLIMLHTTEKNNPTFYGWAIGKGNMQFTGPEDNCTLSLSATAAGPSHIFIPNYYSKDVGKADFIVFKAKDTLKAETKVNSKFNFLIDLDLTANEDVTIDVILDELAGDVIKATGNGRLKIQTGTNVPFTINGRYNIDYGSYDFNFQSFIRKPFILKKDAGNFIEWSGDPYNANIHIDAQYNADNISISDLINNNQQFSFNTASKSYRGTVYVISMLRNKLSKPDISFKLDFPPGSQIKNDPTFNDFLSRLEREENEMLKQVTYLIVFNSFAPYGETNAVGAVNLTSLGVNTLSQIFINQINKSLSGLLYKLTKDKSLQVDLGNAVYSSGSLFSQVAGATTNSVLDRNRLNVKVRHNFFNDKVIITFGGDFDFNLTTTNTQSGNFQWLPDLNVELILTNDRKLRAIVFSKNSLDITGSNIGKRNRQGIGLSYKKDFDYLFTSPKSK